ncbi:MAG: hypothetical protein ACN6NT_10295, partial [Comamonas sp.]
MPGGPRTDLNGTLQAGPDGQGWKLNAALTNSIPGPWDKQALPVRTITADAAFDGTHMWLLNQARIEFGKAGKAHMQAQGHFDAQNQALEGQADLVAVNPTELYSTLDAAPLSGSLKATTNAQQQVQFQLALESAQANTSKGLNIEAARAEGTWKAPELEIRNLYLHALQAQLNSKLLHINTDTQHLKGQLQAQLPGLRSELDMDGGATSGQG